MSQAPMSCKGMYWLLQVVTHSGVTLHVALCTFHSGHAGQYEMRQQEELRICLLIGEKAASTLQQNVNGMQVSVTDTVQVKMAVSMMTEVRAAGTGNLMAIIETTDMLISLTDKMTDMMIATMGTTMDTMGKMIDMTGVTSVPEGVTETMRAAEVTEAAAVEITGMTDNTMQAAALLYHKLSGRACALTPTNTLPFILSCCIETSIFYQVLLACTCQW